MGRGRRGTSSGKEKQTERSEREREGGGKMREKGEFWGGGECRNDPRHLFGVTLLVFVLGRPPNICTQAGVGGGVGERRCCCCGYIGGEGLLERDR